MTAPRPDPPAMTDSEVVAAIERLSCRACDDKSPDFASDLAIVLAEVDRLKGELADQQKRYAELIDALCSKGWAPRNDHASVIRYCTKLRELQQKIIAKDVDERMEAQQAEYEMGIESEASDD